MAKNDGIGNPVQDPFPGIAAPQSTGAAGSAADRAPAPDRAATVVTPPAGEAWAEEPVLSPGTVQPGQTAASPISPGPAQDYGDTGAGRGRARVDSSGRYSWQSKAGD